MIRFFRVFLLLTVFVVSACGTDMFTGTSTPGGSNSTTPSSTDQTGNPTASSEANNVDIIPVTGEINPGRLSHLLDLDVFNQAGEQIGEVKDMILDLDTSLVSYVIVSTGGLLDIAEKEVTVPWNALEVQADTSSAAAPGFVFVLLVDQEVFNNAPSVNMENDLPGIGQPTGNWDNEIRTYWHIDAGVIPVPTSPSVGPLPSQGTVEGVPLKGIILATDALGFDFHLQGQEELDVSIDDMIIDTESGEILYVVIHTNFDNANEQWTPLPLALLNWDANQRILILNNVDQVTLQEAPFFSEGRYPNTTVPGWDETYVFFWDEHDLNQQP